MSQPPPKLRAKPGNRSADTLSIAPEREQNFPETESESDIDQIDALFQQAGLVRHRREKAAGVARRAHFERATPEELFPPPPTPTVAKNGVQWLPVPGWKRIQWLWHGFSTRSGGVSRTYGTEDAPGELNLGFTPDDDRANVLRNRQLLAEAVTGHPATPLVTLRQIHSSVLVVGGPDSCAGGKGSPSKGDGLMTDHPGLLLGIQTADCIPVLVADCKRKAVAAFHAGWRGTVKRIVETGVGRMRLEFGSQPEDLVAAIGPGIGACCYAIGEEVLSEFESQFTYGSELFREVYDADPVRTKYPMLFLTQRAPGHSPIGPSLHVDLIEANRRQLLAAGLDAGAIQVVGACTNCHPELFFSHRASRGRCGRMMSVIGVRA
jgi:YfiH family protein